MPDYASLISESVPPHTVNLKLLNTFQKIVKLLMKVVSVLKKNFFLKIVKLFLFSSRPPDYMPASYLCSRLVRKHLI